MDKPESTHFSKGMLLSILLTVASLIICIISFIVLPDTVITQVKLDGTPSSTMPKMIAILVPFAITLIGPISYCIKKEKKYFLVSAIGIIVEIVMLVVNS